ncbi:hypothetical protein GO993_22420 (plasmid) [Aeromonas salmonicida subsp. salmonicida]|nr:hypothetical protein GO993_22420 [Aeromonas salmonicida subsp. salmonicida]
MYYHPKPAASHAAALRPRQLRHVIRVASITGRQPIRDVMLLWLTHSTGVRVTELASIEIRDLLHPSGQMREEVYLRAAITKHSRPALSTLPTPRPSQPWRRGPQGSPATGRAGRVPVL